MDCYFHSNVPSIAPCVECGKPICATCRDERGRLPQLPACGEGRGRDGNPSADRRPGAAAPGGGPTGAPRRQTSPPPPTRSSRAPSSPSDIRCGRWPSSRFSTASNRASFAAKPFKRWASTPASSGFWALLSLISQIPFLGFSAWVLVPLLAPLFLVASVYYGVKTWNGDDVRIPIVTSWLDERLPHGDTNSR